MLFSSEYLPFLLLSINIKAKIYKTISLSVFFYGFESSSFGLRGVYRLEMFANRTPRKIFLDLRRVELQATWENEERHNLYFSYMLLAR